MRKETINNKGFSLVELIIVIAIMAILGGALAPQLIKYINDSRKSADVDNGQAIATAVNVAMADEDAYDDAGPQTIAALYSAAAPNDFQAAVKSHLGTTNAPKAKFGSNTDFYINITATKGVEIYADKVVAPANMVYPELGTNFQ